MPDRSQQLGHVDPCRRHFNHEAIAPDRPGHRVGPFGVPVPGRRVILRFDQANPEAVRHIDAQAFDRSCPARFISERWARRQRHDSAAVRFIFDTRLPAGGCAFDLRRGAAGVGQFAQTVAEHLQSFRRCRPNAPAPTRKPSAFRMRSIAALDRR